MSEYVVVHGNYLCGSCGEIIAITYTNRMRGDSLMCGECARPNRIPETSKTAAAIDQELIEQLKAENSALKDRLTNCEERYLNLRDYVEDGSQ